MYTIFLIFISKPVQQFNNTIDHIFPEEGIATEILPPYLSNYATISHAKRSGIQVYNNANVVSVDKSEDGKGVVELSDGRSIDVDHIVYVPKLLPNDKIHAPLETNEGYVTNRELLIETDLYAVSILPIDYTLYISNNFF